MILTFVTVYVSSLEVGIITGIIIAWQLPQQKEHSLQVFMHLLHEKKIIFGC